MSTNYYDAENNKLIPIAGKGDFPADYGTKEEFESKKDSLPDGTVFTTTDEFVDKEVKIHEWVNVSMPFTPTRNGFLVARGQANAATGYIIIFEDDVGVANTVSHNGYTASNTIPVIKGKTYTVSTGSMGDITYRFYALD
ncbi:MAG: hypothetical protein MJ162_07305 [Treponema sp.]|nr:hypothetical protein [Treponema sp.]